MSKVSAMENIISELHGPVGAMLWLCGMAETEEDATASAVYANACTQTESVSEESSRQADVVRTTLGKRRASTTTASSVTKRRQTSGGASIQESLPGGSRHTSGHISTTSVSMLGKHILHRECRDNSTKRLRVLEPVSLLALLSEGENESVAPVVCSPSIALAEHSPLPRQQSINPKYAQPSTPVTSRQTEDVQSPHSVIKVGFSHILS